MDIQEVFVELPPLPFDCLESYCNQEVGPSIHPFESYCHQEEFPNLFSTTNSGKKKRLRQKSQFVEESDLKYGCHLCSFRTKWVANLIRHRNRHSGTIVFECHHCKKTFNQISNLKTHITKLHYLFDDKNARAVTKLEERTTDKQKIKVYV